MPQFLPSLRYTPTLRRLRLQRLVVDLFRFGQAKWEGLSQGRWEEPDRAGVARGRELRLYVRL